MNFFYSKDNLLALHFKYDQARRRFVEWAQNEIAVVPDFHKRILFSEEAHFWLNGYVNKQNCRIWSEANPQVYVETPLHLEKLTVWCALWAGGIIGLYFFKNDEGHNVTVNGDCCQVIYSQFGLAIHQNDHQARRRFVEWAQNEIAVVPDFHKRILFSDEAHIWLNGYVNKQNCRIWSEANPQVYVETPLHLEKLTVWCALWAGGILLQIR
ncbi:DUF4817 domain-containing protein [Trichonephila clavipes]|uniref:DUF4817 domain-containing protein n=1 Tax=Trichonephila clavipes TaxID=2585209 RepID=A0A8X6VJ64_TRICX|nr:DUF4817 domain-containing protein [Trichonephila clavipes]